jgi:hypothetical protein
MPRITTVPAQQAQQSCGAGGATSASQPASLPHRRHACPAAAKQLGPHPPPAACSSARPAAPGPAPRSCEARWTRNAPAHVVREGGRSHGGCSQGWRLLEAALGRWRGRAGHAARAVPSSLPSRHLEPIDQALHLLARDELLLPLLQRLASAAGQAAAVSKGVRRDAGRCNADDTLTCQRECTQT